MLDLGPHPSGGDPPNTVRTNLNEGGLPPGNASSLLPVMSVGNSYLFICTYICCCRPPWPLRVGGEFCCFPTAML